MSAVDEGVVLLLVGGARGERAGRAGLGSHGRTASGRLPGARDAPRLRRPGRIDFDDAELAREVGIVGLVLILFEGGLQTSGAGCGA